MDDKQQSVFDITADNNEKLKKKIEEVQRLRAVKELEIEALDALEESLKSRSSKDEDEDFPF